MAALSVPPGACAAVVVGGVASASGCGGGDRPTPARDVGPESAAERRPSQPPLVAYVAVERDDRVAVLQGPRWLVRRRVPVARGPHNAAADPRGRSAAVTIPPAGRLTIFGANGRVRRVIRIGGSPHDVRYMPDGRRLWVSAERGGRLVQVSARTGRVLRGIAVGGPPHDLAVSPDGGGCG